MKTAVAIRHVHFEDLGTLEPLLHEHGYQVRYRNAGLDVLDATEAEAADLLVVLGAPIGAHDDAVYPFLRSELIAIEHRLEMQKPLLGVCLGAQLMARVLGAPVASMGRKEIGFSPLELTAVGQQSALGALPEGTAVLHWHGDQFAIPRGCESLAKTAICPHQAFAVGREALGLQFHLEADADRLEPWLVGHSCELSQVGVDPRVIREQAHMYGKALKHAARLVFDRWLNGLG